MASFQYTCSAQHVVFGRGSLSQLRELAERYGWQRLMLCVTNGARTRGVVAQVEAALGERLAVTYAGAQPHVPEAVVSEATDLAMRHACDALIGLGGGSAIGAAKAVASALEERRAGRPARAALPTDQPTVPIVAIPTTYAGSEMTPISGVTRLQDGVARKITVTDPRLAPRLVVYDPLLTLALPPRETGGTGMNAIAHCIEALYSITRNPLSSAAALAGLRAFSHALPRCCADGADLAARDEALTGAYLAGTALASVAMGLHHGICHVLGGTEGVAHGDANSVMLAHVMRFNLAATAPQLAQAAEAMGLPVSGQTVEAAAGAAIQRVAEWVEQMRLPRRLREIGVQEERLPELARLAFASQTVRNNPEHITNAAQIESLLQAAW